MQMDEANIYLEQLDLTVMMNPNHEIRFKVGATIEPGRERTVSWGPSALILKVGQNWVVEVLFPVAIISVSQHLEQAVYAVENFFKMGGKDSESQYAIVMALVMMQATGIASIISSDRDAPAMLAVCTERSSVEDRWAFMVQEAPLLDESLAYRIYPHEDQWAVEPPDKSSPQLVEDIEQVPDALNVLCGRTNH